MAHNLVTQLLRAVYASPPAGGSAYEKTPRTRLRGGGATLFVRFFPAYFCKPWNAPHSFIPHAQASSVPWAAGN